ncbi:Transposon Ty3-I Gag-Pol polyprotein [Thelohanellus kitauei]|uniref:Transposon Ty3-I Gag-Pol polyprotein n=1 Tax=Thelohanellus kitauei TaxID=669202 RepID=A0A0C2N5L3_THEKT|nr:Transposon Ty3-I Gag-Pol polyprotein [Thelohanellus kitauei]
MLASDPALAHFDPKTSLGIACGASSVDIAVVLFHRNSNGTDRLIPHSLLLKSSKSSSKKIFSNSPRSVFHKSGIRKLTQFFYGRKFVLITDHQPLLSIFSSKMGIPILAANRLERWANILSCFEYEIEYRPTHKHASADVLSRLPQGPNTEFD